MASTSNNVLNFTFECEGGGKFKVVKFDFDEGLSTPFTGIIELASEDADLDIHDLIDQSGTLKVYRNGELERSFNGIIQQFTKGDTGRSYTFYTIILVPSIARLSLRQNSRIFQNQTVVKIVEKLFSEMNITDYALALRNVHEEREYCVQYRENDLEFMHRLLAEEGVFYYFEHQEGKHTLVLADQSSVVNELGIECPYNVLSGGSSPTPFVRQFSMTAKITSSEAVLKDYSFKSPSFDFKNSAYSQDGQDQSSGDYEYFDYPGRYKSQSVGKLFAQTRVDYLRRDRFTALGKSDISPIISGFKLTVSEHPEAYCNKPWLVTHVRHEGEQPQSLEHQGIDGMTRYSNEFSCIPGTHQWKPTPEPKPKMDGLQVAKVTGAENEEIYCDEFGRVKVQFPWDREGNDDENSSCWIRVSDSWAGASMGMIALPRVGHEVLVDFISGDPDQPIITGRTYHATHRQPYKLPEHKTITGIKTKTHKGEGYNELYFDDENEKQLINVHAQRDMNIKVINVKNERVDFDRIQSIGNNESLVVAKDRTITVVGDQHHKTTGAFNELIDGKLSLEVKGDVSSKVSGANGMKVDGDYTVESDSRITFKVGGSFVVIDSGGVYINGSLVTINAGGSPGNVANPTAPNILKEAANSGKMFVENCPLLAKAKEEKVGGGVSIIDLLKTVEDADADQNDPSIDDQDEGTFLDKLVDEIIPDGVKETYHKIGSMVDEIIPEGMKEAYRTLEPMVDKAKEAMEAAVSIEQNPLGVFGAAGAFAGFVGIDDAAKGFESIGETVASGKALYDTVDKNPKDAFGIARGTKKTINQADKTYKVLSDTKPIKSEEASSQPSDKNRDLVYKKGR